MFSSLIIARPIDIGTGKHSGAPAACVKRGLEYMMQMAYAPLVKQHLSQICDASAATTASQLYFAGGGGTEASGVIDTVVPQLGWKCVTPD